ncbi:MAG: DNA-binding response OmpR family regulator [Gammaproteobacteria bacterium]|jgi:DNA-binding response OmpR family regulator
MEYPVLKELTSKYLESLSDKSLFLTEKLHNLNSGDSEAVTAIRLLAHSLHGSGATFGFPEISEISRKVELAESRDIADLASTLIHVIEKYQIINPGNLVLNERNILLVEDDSDISQLLQTLLQDMSKEYCVQIADSVIKAREILANKTWDMVVLDLQLPDIDGRELLKEIVATGENSPMIIVLSGLHDNESYDECISLGASAYLAKPFKPEFIVDYIHKAMRQAEPRTESVSFAQSSAQSKLSLLEPKGQATISYPILLAEDDELIASVIKHRLARESFIIQYVTNGRDALETLKNGKHSLAILDVKMPEMDGFEVLTKIKSEPALRDLPIIMLTAMGNEKDIVRGYQLGADDYILKPFSPAELIAKIKSIVK